MKAVIIWLAKLIAIIVELLLAVAVGTCFGVAIAIVLLYVSTYGGAQ